MTGSIKEKLKKHKWFFLILLIWILFWSMNSVFMFNTLNGHAEVAARIPQGEFLRQSVKENRFPHWADWYYGGDPYFSNGQNTVLKLFTLLSYITPTLESNFKIEKIITALIASIAIYLLMLEIKIKPKIAVIPSLVYLFNVSAIQRSLTLGDDFLNSFVWIPLIFLFAIKCIKSKGYKDVILYAILTGFVFALQFNGGYVSIFVYTAFLFGVFLLIFMLVNFSRPRLIKKILACGLIAAIVALGLSSIKILPVMEFSKNSILNQPRTFEAAKGYHLEINSFGDLKKPFLFLIDRRLMDTGGYDSAAIGIIPFIFLLFAFVRIKNKYVLFSLVALILLFMIASGSSLFYILWRWFPGFNRQHHIARILTVVQLPAAIMVGFGAQTFFKKAEKRFSRLPKYAFTAFFLIIILLMLLNFGYFSVNKEYNVGKEFKVKDLVEQNGLFQYMSGDKDIFRIHNIKTDYIGSEVGIFAVPNNLKAIHGVHSVWNPEYLNEYFSGYTKLAPYKFLGMLNTKYIYSEEEINDSRLRFVKEFEACPTCREFFWDNPEDGPYLYYNNLYLPRAYVADHAILTVGNYNEAKGTMYLLMTNPKFNPSNTAIVTISKSINDIPIDTLKRFNAVFLTSGSIDQNSIQKLQEYKSSNGTIFPDVLENKDRISELEVDNLLSSFQGSYEDVRGIEIQDYSPNGYKITVDNKKGFLVLAEKFFMYQAWEARSEDQEQEMFRANGINTMIYLDGTTEEISVEYRSKQFQKGLIISSITLLFVIVYIVVYLVSKKKHQVD